MVPRCLTCGAGGEFGYRNKETGELIWYCADHRVGRFYADARLSTDQGMTSAQDIERSDSEIAEQRSGDPHQMDVAARHRPDSGVDGAGLAGPTDRAALPQAVVNGQPYFDAEGRFIHPCRCCGKPAMLGFGVSLRAGKLGAWYCDGCTPSATRATETAKQISAAEVAGERSS
jgi:hypothetical protein